MASETVNSSVKSASADLPYSARGSTSAETKPTAHRAAVSADKPNTYTLSVFGNFLLRDAAGKDISPLSRKARAMVAYLALTRGAAARDDLAALLWTDRGIEQARSSLRQACYELRHKLPPSPALLIFNRDEIMLDRGLLTTDVAAIGSESDANALAASFTPARRVLLRDLDDLSPAFDEWLRIERVRQTDSRREVAREAAQRVLTEGRWPDAQRVAGAYLTMDPTDEDIARIAMAASANSAQIGEVRRFYRIHAKALRSELDCDPSLAIDTLLAEIAGGTIATSPSSRGPDASQPDRQAPDGAERPHDGPPLGGMFRAPRSRRRYGIAAAGLIVAIGLAASTRRYWMPVHLLIPRVAVETFAASADDKLARAVGDGLPAMVAEDLVGTNTPIEVVDNAAPAARQASLVVRGSMATAAGVLRATVQLVAIPSARVVWTHTFDRDAREADQFGEQVSLRIARELNCAYSDGRAPHFDADAEFARLSLAHCDALTDDDDEALILSRQITERAPHFAHGLAEHAYDLAAKSLWLPPKLADANVIQARNESDRALAIDPHDGLAYAARLVTMGGLSQFAKREALIRHALGQAPTNPSLYMAKANDMWGLGRLQDALGAARRSSQYNRFLPGYVVEEAGIEGDLGEAQEARRLIAKAQTLWPHQRFVDRIAYRFALYWGNPDDAARLLDADRIAGYSEGHLHADRAFMAWRKAPSQATAAAAKRVIEDEAANGRPEPEYVQLLAAMGQIDAAYVLAERLPAEDHGDLGWYRDYVARFRADRRFMPLAARLGLAKIWLQTGLWPDFCRNERLSYNCRIAAQAALSSLQSIS